MYVKLKPQDDGILTAGLADHKKKLETVIKTMRRLNLATMEADAELARVEWFQGEIEGRKEDHGGTLRGDMEITDEVLRTIQISVALYIRKTEVLKTEQLDMTIGTEETLARESDAKNLLERLGGQNTLFDMAEEKEIVDRTTSDDSEEGATGLRQSSFLEQETTASTAGKPHRAVKKRLMHRPAKKK